jgi:hypothetical protein
MHRYSRPDGCVPSLPHLARDQGPVGQEGSSLPSWLPAEESGPRSEQACGQQGCSPGRQRADLAHGGSPGSSITARGQPMRSVRLRS